MFKPQYQQEWNAMNQLKRIVDTGNTQMFHIKENNVDVPMSDTVAAALFESLMALRPDERVIRTTQLISDLKSHTVAVGELLQDRLLYEVTPSDGNVSSYDLID